MISDITFWLFGPCKSFSKFWSLDWKLCVSSVCRKNKLFYRFLVFGVYWLLAATLFDNLNLLAHAASSHTCSPPARLAALAVLACGERSHLSENLPSTSMYLPTKFHIDPSSSLVVPITYSRAACCARRSRLRREVASIGKPSQYFNVSPYKISYWSVQ